MLHVRRDTLVRVLLAHGEDDLAERAPSLTDEDLKRIGERADDCAFSGEHALRSGASMGVSRAISLATVDVLEGASRELHRKEAQSDPSAEEEALGRLGVGHRTRLRWSTTRIQANASPGSSGSSQPVGRTCTRHSGPLACAFTQLAVLPRPAFASSPRCRFRTCSDTFFGRRPRPSTTTGRDLGSRRAQIFANSAGPRTPGFRPFAERWACATKTRPDSVAVIGCLGVRSAIDLRPRLRQRDSLRRHAAVLGFVAARRPSGRLTGTRRAVHPSRRRSYSVRAAAYVPLSRRAALSAVGVLLVPRGSIRMVRMVRSARVLRAGLLGAFVAAAFAPWAGGIGAAAVSRIGGSRTALLQALGVLRHRQTRADRSRALVNQLQALVPSLEDP